MELSDPYLISTEFNLMSLKDNLAALLKSSSQIFDILKKSAQSSADRKGMLYTVLKSVPELSQWFKLS